ncbi:MAG: hypothetical protein CMH39_08325 [Micrococcales bacterium]|nr:hypothetical protein [Micrococcales bacterium]
MRHSWVMSASSRHDSITSGSGAADTTALNALNALGASESSDSAQASVKTPMASLAAPIVALGATYVARKTLASAYRAATGAAPPSNTDRTVPLGRVLAWAAIGSATAAVIEVVAFRSMARFFGE